MTADEIARELRQQAAKLNALADILEAPRPKTGEAGYEDLAGKRVRVAAQDDPRGEADR